MAYVAAYPEPKSPPLSLLDPIWRRVFSSNRSPAHHSAPSGPETSPRAAKRTMTAKYGIRGSEQRGREEEERSV
eukprot:2321112-Rhodomonas_salina.3